MIRCEVCGNSFENCVCCTPVREIKRELCADCCWKQLREDTLDDVETYPEGCDNYGSLDND